MAMEFFTGLKIGSKIKKSFAYGKVSMIELPESEIEESQFLNLEYKKKKLKPTKILPIRKTLRSQWHDVYTDNAKEDNPFTVEGNLNDNLQRSESVNKFSSATKCILDRQLSVFTPASDAVSTPRYPELKAFFDPSIGEDEKKRELLLALLIEQFRLNIRDQKKAQQPMIVNGDDAEDNLENNVEVGLFAPNKKEQISQVMNDWNGWTDDQILNLGLLLFIEEIARNPNHPLHQLINYKLKAEWAKKVRGYSAGHINWLLNATYWLRMTPIDLFYNGREMSKFDVWTGYHGITGNPLMMLRGVFYLKGFMIGIAYFYHSGKFDYVIFCNTLNDGVWFVANTINITDNFIQLHHAIAYHQKYYEPTMDDVFHSHWLATHANWLNSAAACSVMFSGLYLFFDLPRDLSRDAYLLWEACKHPERFLDANEESWKRFWTLVCNVLCNAGMGGARIGISFSSAATALSVVMPWTIMALFFLTVAYGAWKLSKIKRDKNYVMPGWIPFGIEALPWMAGTSLFVFAPAGIALMILAGAAGATAMLASGGAIFVAAAMIFGLSVYYFARSKGIDQAVSVRLGFMSAMMGFLITGAVIALLFAGGPFSTIAVTGVLFVMALGAFREWNKDMAVIRESFNKDKRNRILDEAWKSYPPLSANQLTNGNQKEVIKKDPVHQMLALEAYKLRECSLVLKSSPEETSQQNGKNPDQEGVYTLTKNEDGKTAILRYQNAEGAWQEKPVPIKSIPKCFIKQGWDDSTPHLIRPMMAEAEFITSNGAKFHRGKSSTEEITDLKHCYAASWCSKFSTRGASNNEMADNDETARNDPVLLDNSYVIS